MSRDMKLQAVGVFPPSDSGHPSARCSHPTSLRNECFADELICDAEGSCNSHAIKKLELDRVAKSNRSFPTAA
ncbi:hypothetical protein ACRRTK_008787 [Alexandromys fortis]